MRVALAGRPKRSAYPGPAVDRVVATFRLQSGVLEKIEARPVSEGWSLAVIETRGAKEIIVGDEVAGIALAPPLQVYLDLLQTSGRAREMAEHLRHERLEL